MSLSNLNHSISSPIENNFKSEANTTLLDSRTILLIDDEEMVVKITEAMLKKIGCKILKATNGHEGLKLFQRYRNIIDLIICDMIMPEMDGLQFVHKLREIDPRVKVLLSSGSLIDEDEKDVANRGFDGLIKKPYKLNDLSEKIGNILR
jgi:two-component system cell cycle sensor histidine kinase/response regulator CckA